MDPLRQEHLKVAFREVLRREKDDVEEWGIYTSPDVVIQHIRNRIADLGSPPEHAAPTVPNPKSEIRNLLLEDMPRG